MVGSRHEKILDKVLLESLHTLDPLAASVLGFKIVYGHAFHISEICHGYDGIILGDHILHGNIIFVKTYYASPVVSVFIGNLLDLGPYHAKKQLLVCKDRLKLCNFHKKLFMLVLNLFSFQTGESPKTHINDRLGLRFGEAEALHQPFLCNLRVLAASYNLNDLVDMIKRYEQSL